MLTHAHRAHWHAQETVAKTILAAAHAKRLATQGHLTHVRWASYRWRAIAVWWGEARLPMRAMRGYRFLLIIRGALCVTLRCSHSRRASSLSACSHAGWRTTHVPHRTRRSMGWEAR
jgi:hypothetical protein